MATPLIDTVIHDHMDKLAELLQIYQLEEKLVSDLQKLKTQSEGEWPTEQLLTELDRARARAERFGLTEKYGVMSIEEHMHRHPEMYPDAEQTSEMVSISTDRLKELLDIELDHYMQRRS
jgi:hypothetical protein